jgi:polysaccharide biosynthesis/export protein
MAFLLNRLSAIHNKALRIRRQLTALIALASCVSAFPLRAQEPTKGSPATGVGSRYSETSQDYNQKIAEIAQEKKAAELASPIGDYQVGPEDLLEISVLEAPDLNRTARVADDGTVSLALLGSVEVAGLTTREAQEAIADRLRQTYMKDPQVSVFVQEMKSHPVSVFGAVEKPGVYQIRSAKTLVEVLSMAQGLTNDAGDTVVVMRHPGDPAVPALASLQVGSPPQNEFTSQDKVPAAPGPLGLGSEESSSAEAVSINLKDLIDSGSPQSNVLVYPGDVVKVSRAGIVYVVGQVQKPGGFLLKTNENISVLQAVALAEGLTQTSKGKEARIFVAGNSGEAPKEIAINLDKIMAGKMAAPLLKPNDVLFVPSSGGKQALHVLEQSTAGIIGTLGGAAIYRW